MRLLIVRHAVAMEREEYHATPGRDDALRPLTDKGIRKMKKNAEGLRSVVGRPALLVTSPLKRAVQTAKILASAWGASAANERLVVSDVLNPDADPSDLAIWLNDTPEALIPHATVAVVGHEPHLTHLIGWLLSGQARSIVELKKGGACLIEFDGMIVRGRGRLLWLATPPMLRAFI